jgi:hypothetical protein
MKPRPVANYIERCRLEKNKASLHRSILKGSLNIEQTQMNVFENLAKLRIGIINPYKARLPLVGFSASPTDG